MTSKGFMVLGKGTMSDKEHYEWLLLHAGKTFNEPISVSKQSLIKGLISILQASIPTGDIFMNKETYKILVKIIGDQSNTEFWYGYPVRCLENAPDGQVILTGDFSHMQTPEEIKAGVVVMNFQP